MGRRPHRCYRTVRGPTFIKSAHNRGVPDPKIKIFDLGNKNAPADQFPLHVKLIATQKEQLSSESLEAARITANRHCNTNIGKSNFHLKIRIYPFHVLRINKMLSCAGADRLQTGMRGAFGKPYGTAARVKPDTCLLSIRTKDTEAALKSAKRALQLARAKFPGKYDIVISKKWGFTKLDKEEYRRLKEEKKIIPVGNNISIIKEKGSIDTYRELIEKAEN